MRYTLLAALVAATAYAAPTDPDDWTEIEGALPPEACFTFKDGTLLATATFSLLALAAASDTISHPVCYKSRHS